MEKLERRVGEDLPSFEASNLSLASREVADGRIARSLFFVTENQW